MATPAEQMTFGTPDQIEVLVALGSVVREQTALHQGRRTLWFPNDLQPADDQNTEEQEEGLRQMREDARGLPDTIRVALALNLLTEEGLPHFHRLIATHLGNESPWSLWNNLWTAEEDRHGCIMRDYVRDARVFNMGAMERLQFQYLDAGYEPEWERDPYRLLAYTSLQEKATQVSHANTGRMAGRVEGRIQRILAHISGDESRHYQFYRACFAEILRTDPNRALVSLQKVTLGFSMPGHNIAGFDDMSEVLRRAGIFGPRQYKLIVEELLEFWNIGGMTGLNDIGRDAQEKIMKVPSRLERIGDYLDAKSQKRSFQFHFIYDQPLSYNFGCRCERSAATAR